MGDLAGHAVPAQLAVDQSEYLYADLGSKDFLFDPTSGSSGKKVFLIDHIVRAGLNLHF
jgi:hypothetical protein